MAKKKDILREKLNALKPSIPTNTRDKAIKEAETKVQPVPDAKTKPQDMPAVKLKSPAKTQLIVKINPQETRQTAPTTKPEQKSSPKGAVSAPPTEGKRFTFNNTFILPALMQENLASFNRIQDVMIDEMNNINKMYINSCRQCVGICYETIRDTCTLFTQCPVGKWPFLFQALQGGMTGRPTP